MLVLAQTRKFIVRSFSNPRYYKHINPPNPSSSPCYPYVFWRMSNMIGTAEFTFVWSEPSIEFIGSLPCRPFRVINILIRKFPHTHFSLDSSFTCHSYSSLQILICFVDNDEEDDEEFHKDLSAFPSPKVLHPQNSHSGASSTKLSSKGFPCSFSTRGLMGCP